jgi:hypothetical protein
MQNHDDARDRDRDRNSSEDAFWSAALLGSLSRSRTSSHQSFSISLTSVARSIVFLVGVVLGIVLIGPVVRTIIPTRSVVRLSVASTPLTQIGTGTLVITTTKAAISAVVAPDTLTNMYPGASETVQVTVQNVGTVPLQPTLAISGSTNAVSVAADPCTTCVAVPITTTASRVPLTIAPGTTVTFPVTVTGTDALTPSSSVVIEFIVSGVQA